jgi:tetratricopeptide (TPR) repeat protein
MSEEERIRTNFMDNQARDLSKPALSKTKLRVIIAVALIALAFGLYQAINFVMNLGKITALNSVAVTLQHPGMLDGVAMVDVTINNLNTTAISNIGFQYDILGPNGVAVATGVVTIPGTVPSGDSRTFPHVKLGQLTEQAARMQAKVVDVQLGAKPNLTADQEYRFSQLAALPDEEKQPELERFVKEAPRFMPGYVQLARTYMAANEYQKAIGILKKAVEIEPQYGDAHYNLALSLQHLGQKKAAGKELRKSLDLMPDDPDVQRTAQHFDGD